MRLTSRITKVFGKGRQDIESLIDFAEKEKTSVGGALGSLKIEPDGGVKTGVNFVAFVFTTSVHDKTSD